MSKEAKRVVAVGTSDIHMSLRAPAARAEQDNWLEVQDKRLRELYDIARSNGRCPILVAGDLLHQWNSPAELVNWFIRKKPADVDIYAVPGNHDLPYHDYAEISRSAYWTLVEAGAIKNLAPGDPVKVITAGGMRTVLHGFPCGFKLWKCQDEKQDDVLHIAVVHQYIWKSAETAHAAAELEDKIGKFVKRTTTYDFTVFGDNHITFSAPAYGIVNCGTLLRRRAEEKAYHPSAYLLYGDGTFARHVFDCTQDKFLEVDDLLMLKKAGLDPEELLEALQHLGEKSIDFARALKHRINTDKHIGTRVAELVGLWLDKALEELDK